MINLTQYVPNILVVGDLMIDHYVWGACERISPEAPVPVLKVNEENNRLGGACNVANNIISLGARASICGIIGNDNDGEILLSMLKSVGIGVDFVVRDSAFSTIKKTRLLASNQQILRVDREFSVLGLDSAILEKIEKNIADFDGIVVSDYAKGALGAEFTQKLIALSRRHDKFILCDPKGSDYSKYAHATLITPNKKEAQIAASIRIDSAESLQRAGFALKEMCSLDYSMITLGEDGMAIFKEEMIEIPTFAKEVFDVTGAGDTVIASLAFGLACGLDIVESARFANAAAAVVVGKIGSASASLGEIFMYLDIEIDNLTLIKNLQCEGKKIVFTNGCFDILHSGHVSYLRKAKEFGDVLVVGLNSDSSVRRLKGDSRPINQENDRKLLLESLCFVDFVIIFDEDTPLHLIQKIKPDVLVKGADYKDKVVVGSDVVPEVRLVDFVPHKSTTNIIERIRGESDE